MLDASAQPPNALGVRPGLAAVGSVAAAPTQDARTTCAHRWTAGERQEDQLRQALNSVLINPSRQCLLYRLRVSSGPPVLVLVASPLMAPSPLTDYGAE